MVKPSRRSRRFLPSGVLLVGAAALLAVYLYWWRLPVGSGPAGPVVSRDAFQHPWTTRPVFLVGLGDSVTAGFGATKGHSYFEQLQINPTDEFADMRGICLSAVMPRFKATNLAISGSTSLQCLLTELPRLAVQPTNLVGVVVMTTGGNDLIHNYGRTPPAEGAMYGASLAQAKPWIESYRLRLDAIVAQVERRFPGGCHIFLANIYDPTDGVGSARRVGLPAWPDALAVLEAYNQVIAECAARHPSVHLVDIHTPFLGHGLFCRQFWRTHYHPHDPHFWYHDILEDPNDRGYDAIRRQFLLAMARDLPSALAEGRASN